MLELEGGIVIPADEIHFTAIRAQGPGGQHVNKVATAVHLRFDVRASRALPEDVRSRVLALSDRRISADGIVNIKVGTSRSQEANRRLALERLETLLSRGLVAPAVRKPTRPPRAALDRRREDKARRSRLKATRRSPDE